MLDGFDLLNNLQLEGQLFGETVEFKTIGRQINRN